MISLLMLGAIINYLTRSTLAVAAPTIMGDLGITTRQYSWIVGAFQGAIMLQPICGYVMDVVGLKFGFALPWQSVSPGPCRASSAGVLLQRRNRCRGTSIGFTEAPHVYKRNGYYYLITAEGGTGWGSRNTSSRWQVSSAITTAASSTTSTSLMTRLSASTCA
jgi:MFS family permease